MSAGLLRAKGRATKGSRAGTRTRRTLWALGGRSERVVNDVLESSVAELAESGYVALRIDRIAAAAGVNKTTIYRRWPTKAELIAATVKRIGDVFGHALPDTGSIETDLLEAFRWRLSFRRHVEGRAWARMLSEKHVPEVEAIVKLLVRERSAGWLRMIERAVERGELPRGTDAELMFEMIKLTVEERFFISDARLDDDVLERVIHTVVTGARAGTLVRRPPPG